MNQKQIALRRRRRNRWALLIKEVSLREYKQLLKGSLLIRGKTLWNEEEWNVPIRELESDYVRKEREFNEQVDLLLGIKKPKRTYGTYESWFQNVTTMELQAVIHMTQNCRSSPKQDMRIQGSRPRIVLIDDLGQ